MPLCSLCNTILLFHTLGLSDFVPINQVVTFQPGDTEQFVTFTSNTDTTVEGTEMLTAVLSNPSAGATLGNDTATISIMDVGGEYYQHCCSCRLVLHTLMQLFHILQMSWWSLIPPHTLLLSQKVL